MSSRRHALIALTVRPARLALAVLSMLGVVACSIYDDSLLVAKPAQGEPGGNAGVSAAGDASAAASGEVDDRGGSSNGSGGREATSASGRVGTADDGGASNGGADNGGASNSGANNGGAGNSGASNGGVHSGGASDGGGHNGGASNGGASNGGASNGGTGGNSKGGSAGAATGGTGAGGSAGSAGANGGSATSGSSGGGTGPTGVELATGKSFTMSSEQVTHEASKGNDGDLTTRWCASAATFPQWWRVDLGAPHALVGFSVQFEHADRQYSYLIETSTDDLVYVQQASFTNRVGAPQTGAFPPSVSARYVRITVVSTVALDAAHLTWASFYEFSVTGN